MTSSDVLEKIPGLKGTIIAEFLEVMQSGKFDLPEVPVGEGEKVIGEMNDYEKALCTLAEKYSNDVQAIVLRFEGQGKPVARAEESKLKEQLEHYHQCHHLFSALMWENITVRLINQADVISPESGIRLGGKVVLVFKRDVNPLEKILKEITKRSAN